MNISPHRIRKTRAMLENELNEIYDSLLMVLAHKKSKEAET